MKEFKKLAYPFIEVSDEEWEFFSSHFVYSEFKNGSLLLQQGEREKHQFGSCLEVGTSD